MRKLTYILLAFGGMLLFSEDMKAQQSANGFNFEVEQVENSEKSKLILDKAFKKSKFDEIEIDYLPQVVKDVLSDDFKGATTKKAYVKKKDGINLYKVEIEIDGETKDLYSDINGNWTDQDGIEYI